MEVVAFSFFFKEWWKLRSLFCKLWGINVATGIPSLASGLVLPVCLFSFSSSLHCKYNVSIRFRDCTTLASVLPFSWLENSLLALETVLPMSASERRLDFLVWWRCLRSSVYMTLSFSSAFSWPISIWLSVISSVEDERRGSGGGFSIKQLSSTKICKVGPKNWLLIGKMFSSNTDLE